MDKSKLTDEIVERTSNSFDKAEELGEILKNEYMTALNQLQKDVSAFYTRYGSDNSMTYADAVKYLSKVELRPFREKLEEYTKLIDAGDVELLAEIKALDVKEKITRLENLMLEIRTELVKLGISEEEQLALHLAETLKVNYIGSYAGIKGVVEATASFSKFNPTLIKETVKFPWSGESFSEIIWGNSNKLARDLKSELTQGFIKGTSVQKMSSNIAKRMENSYKNALRVVRTESAHVLNKAAIMSYADMGVTHIEFAAILDGRTSAVCLSLNGDIIPINEAVPGVNTPPLHPNCRSTVLPVIDDEIDTGKDSNDSDIIKADEVIKGHKTVPPVSDPNKTVDYLYSTGYTSQRVFYGSDGKLVKSINTTNHGNPSKHPYGLVGEHVHEYLWDGGKIVSRKMRNLTGGERRLNRDILPRKEKE